MFNFEKFLKEMAMKSYNVGHQNPNPWERTSNDDIKNTFSKQDRKAIANATWIKNLEKALSRLTKYNFNIILIEPTKPGMPDYKFQAQVKEYIEDNNIETKGHITFAKNSSTGHALTPWMVLHNIGHAVFQTTENQFIFRTIKAIIIEIFKRQLKISGFQSPEKFDPSLSPHIENLVLFAKRMFLFKSAQHTDTDRDVNAMSELIYELTAEYIWHGGRIRYKLPTKLDDEPKPYDHDKLQHYSRSVDTRLTIEDIANMIEEIEFHLDKVLSNCVDEIIYDYYT